MSNSLCMGCGGQLQNTDSKAPFYTPKPITNDTVVYCQRCYRIAHYHEQSASTCTASDYQNMIATISTRDGLLVKVIDVFDLEGSMIPQITKITARQPLVVLANKRDLLPKVISDAKLKHRIIKRLNEINLKPQDVIIVSAVKRYQIDAALDTLFKLSAGKDVYIVGATNVGKSSLINAFMNASSGINEHRITTNDQPGTTQGLIPIPFGSVTLYDTPGLINPNHMSNVVSAKTYQALHPKKEIKPITFQLNAEQTIFMGGLARLDFDRGPRSQFTFYCAPSVPLHRRKQTDADDFYVNHLSQLLSPPTEKDPPFELHRTRFNVKANQKIDVVIPGLGFVAIKGEGQVTVFTPKTVKPYMREALI